MFTSIWRRLIAAAVVIVLPLAATADSHGEGYVLHGLDDLQFGPVMPGLDAEMALLWGNPAAGPFAMMLRFPPGYEAPMHTHSSDYHAVIVDGGARHWIEGEDRDAAPIHGPGTYWFQPAGQVHGDANPTDAPVTVFLYFPGPIDFRPVQ